jgi:aminoacylase
MVYYIYSSLSLKKSAKKMELSCRTIILYCYIICLVLFISSSISITKAKEEEEEDRSSSIISRFQEYLQINTAQPNPKYNEAAKFILSQAQSLSLEAQTLEFVEAKPFILLKWSGSDPNLPSILLNSHTDVVPVEHDKWSYPPFGAHIDSQGNIYARGSQDMKCVGMQYLEAIRKLKASGFQPLRSVYLSFVPDEEIGGHAGVEKFADTHVFNNLNVGIVLDEGTFY